MKNNRGRYKTERIYHIFDANAKMNVPWRYYKTPERAVNAALILVYWLEVGNTYTVYNSETSTVVREFRRTVDGVRILE